MKKFIIYKGSNRGLANYLKSASTPIKVSFTSMVVTMDKERKAVKAKRSRYELVVVKESEYFAITSQANNTLLSILEEITVKDAVVILQNPQNFIEDEIILHYPTSHLIIEEEVTKLEPKHILNVITKSTMMTKWKLDLLKTLNYFSSNQADKPYVIVLYGGSGLGKTHIVKQLVKEMGEEMLSFQLSNYQEIGNIGLLLGEKFPSKDIYSKIKLSSNSLILLDEFDKIHRFGYNAFYDMFDEPIASSDYVSVNIRNRIFIATTNFKDIEEIEAKLPNPIVNRINKFIHVPDLTIQDINKYIESKQLDSQLKEEVQAEVNKLDTVNLRIIDNLIEDKRINEHWDQFIDQIKIQSRGGK